jgi:RNA polymerase sigma factor (sigma-70 family)
MDKTLYKEIAKYQNSKDPVLGNLKLVVHFAKKYQGMGLPLEDLIQEGMIGLCRARDKYNVNKGKFSTYASTWIKATIRAALNEKGRMIRIPSHKAANSDNHVPTQKLNSNYNGSTQPSIDLDYQHKHTDHEAEILLQMLKPTQAKIVRMKFGIGYDEMKTVEIAETLGMSVQAVNGNLRNALKKMNTLK